HVTADIASSARNKDSHGAVCRVGGARTFRPPILRQCSRSGTERLAVTQDSAGRSKPLSQSERYLPNPSSNQWASVGLSVRSCLAARRRLRLPFCLIERFSSR